MKIGICQERRADERRVAATADTVRKYVGQGHEVLVEAGAGRGAAVTDAAYREAGASIHDDPRAVLGAADIMLKVRAPLGPGDGELDEIAAMKEGAALVGMLAPYDAAEHAKLYAQRRIDAFALELMPRITRAQSMDVLSSQANLAGYRTVIEAANYFGRAFPMLMTAAGTIPPAKVLVLGCGVAGLQALATARRLGAQVTGTDVRPETKEQVESLGAKFLEVEGMAEAVTAEGGYATAVSEDFLKRQAEAVTQALKRTDIAICTALVPGKKAPTLISEEQAGVMKPGSVIVDLAVEQGGNTPLSRPDEARVTDNDLTVLGFRNLPARVPVDASAMYARNLLNFLGVLVDKERGERAAELSSDAILKETALTHNGEVVSSVVQSG